MPMKSIAQPARVHSPPIHLSPRRHRVNHENIPGARQSGTHYRRKSYSARAKDRDTASRWRAQCVHHRAGASGESAAERAQKFQWQIVGYLDGGPHRHDGVGGK